MVGRYSTCFNSSIRVVAAPTDPKWREQLEDAKELDQKNRDFYGFRGDRDGELCRVQCKQQAAGLEMAELVKTFYGFRARTVFMGGEPFGPRFDTYEELERWLVDVWHAEAPSRREVIDRGMGGR